MKRSKSIKPNQISEPEVEYVKEKHKKKSAAKYSLSHIPKELRKFLEEPEPKLLTNDDPFMLDEIFGLWKNKKVSLKKRREKTWGNRGR